MGCEREKQARTSKQKLTSLFLLFFFFFHLFSPLPPSHLNQIFRLAFGPKVFIVVSDPELTKQVLVTDAANYSKGLLSEILDFVMGQGLIPADGEVWRERRRAVVPALHRRYIESMLGMFGDSALHGASVLERKMIAGGGGEAAALDSSLHHSPPTSSSSPSVVVEIENFFSRLTLDIIGKAVFNYDFDSLKNDDPFIQAVYTALREAEYRSTAFVPYWNFAPLRWLVRNCFFLGGGGGVKRAKSKALFCFSCLREIEGVDDAGCCGESLREEVGKGCRREAKGRRKRGKRHLFLSFVFPLESFLCFCLCLPPPIDAVTAASAALSQGFFSCVHFGHPTRSHPTTNKPR